MCTGVADPTTRICRTFVDSLRVLFMLASSEDRYNAHVAASAYRFARAAEQVTSGMPSSRSRSGPFAHLPLAYVVHAISHSIGMEQLLERRASCDDRPLHADFSSLLHMLHRAQLAQCMLWRALPFLLRPYAPRLNNWLLDVYFRYHRYLKDLNAYAP